MLGRGSKALRMTSSSGRFWSLGLWGGLLGITVGLLACKPKNTGIPEQSASASIVIKELNIGTYEKFRMEIRSLEGSGSSVVQREFTRGAGSIQLQVPPSRYRFILEYLQGSTVVYSSQNCSETLRNDVRTLVKGPNDLVIRVCGPNQDIAVPEGAMGAAAGTFEVRDAQLYDPSGKVFVMRGMNNPHAYYSEKAYAALSDIKDMGFNTVRIVWCADTLVRTGRCESKDFQSAANLERILSRMRTLKMVAVLNLQNATGSDNRADLQAMASYLLKPEVKSILLRYRDMLLLNVANEWYGTWNKKTDYLDAYKDVISQLRKGGLPHTLIIDARGYGQDVSSLVENAAAFQALDSNLLLSAHLYDVFGNSAGVKTLFTNMRNAKIPFMVGEFGCSHGAGKVVACDSIMLEAQTGPYRIGTIAWSWTGNNADLADLDVVESKDWRTLTAWGSKLVQTPSYGIAETSQEACMFNAKACQANLQP